MTSANYEKMVCINSTTGFIMLHEFSIKALCLLSTRTILFLCAVRHSLITVKSEADGRSHEDGSSSDESVEADGEHVNHTAVLLPHPAVNHG